MTKQASLMMQGGNCVAREGEVCLAYARGLGYTPRGIADPTTLFFLIFLFALEFPPSITSSDGS